MTATTMSAAELSARQSAVVWFVGVLLLLLAVEFVYITIKLTRDEGDMALRRLWMWAHPVATVAVRILVVVAFLLGAALFSLLAFVITRSEAPAEIVVAMWGAGALLVVGAGCTIYVWVRLRGTVDLDLLEED